MHRKKDGSFNLTGFQIAQLAEVARQRGVETSWEIDGGLVVWNVTDQDFRTAIAYLGSLGRGRVIEVLRVEGM